MLNVSQAFRVNFPAQTRFVEVVMSGHLSEACALPRHDVTISVELLDAAREAPMVSYRCPPGLPSSQCLLSPVRANSSYNATPGSEARRQARPKPPPAVTPPVPTDLQYSPFPLQAPSMSEQTQERSGGLEQKRLVTSGAWMHVGGPRNEAADRRGEAAVRPFYYTRGPPSPATAIVNHIHPGGPHSTVRTTTPATWNVSQLPTALELVQPVPRKAATGAATPSRALAFEAHRNANSVHTVTPLRLRSSPTALSPEPVTLAGSGDGAHIAGRLPDLTETSVRLLAAEVRDLEERAVCSEADAAADSASAPNDVVETFHRDAIRLAVEAALSTERREHEIEMQHLRSELEGWMRRLRAYPLASPEIAAAT
jgi:hypothetical protein